MELCNSKRLRLTDKAWLNNECFKNDPDAKKALYLLELERIVIGFPEKEMVAARETLQALHNQLVVEDIFPADWVRLIGKAQKDLQKSMTVSQWAGSSVGAKTGYGVGFFRPSIGGFLDEMSKTCTHKVGG